MGGIVQSLFGGSNSKSGSTSTSTSGNNAFGQLSSALGGNIATGNSAFGAMASALGLGPNAGDTTGVNNFMNSAGYKTMLDQGSKAITNNAAAKGMLNSGATLKGLDTFGQNLGQQGFTNYLTQLGTLFNGGIQSANTISGAGNFSNASSNSTTKSSTSNGIIPVLFG